MRRTAREKIDFILNYHENFDTRYLLEDCLDELTESQLEKIFKDYEDDYEQAWEDYKDAEDYYCYHEEIDDEDD